MKKFIPLLLLLSLLLCGCGRAEESAEVTAAPMVESALRFSTTDLDGRVWDESCLTGKKLTMINFFEPWCGPCVQELPELQRLSENHAGTDFQLLGVYSTEDGVAEVLAEAGVSYPVLRYVSELEPYTSQYVPTTVFLDENGELLKQIIGSRSYGEWEAITTDLLND